MLPSLRLWPLGSPGQPRGPLAGLLGSFVVIMFSSTLLDSVEFDLDMSIFSFTVWFDCSVSNIYFVFVTWFPMGTNQSYFGAVKQITAWGKVMVPILKTYNPVPSLNSSKIEQYTVLWTVKLVKGFTTHEICFKMLLLQPLQILSD